MTHEPEKLVWESELYDRLKAELENEYRARRAKNTQRNRDRIASAICFRAIHEAAVVLLKTLDENIPLDLYAAMNRAFLVLHHLRLEMIYWDDEKYVPIEAGSEPCETIKERWLP